MACKHLKTSVKEATHSETEEKVAIKIFDKEKIKQEDLGESIKKEVRGFICQVTLMKMINHPNIVKLREVLASNSKIFLVLELVEGGDFFTKIDGRPCDARVMKRV